MSRFFKFICIFILAAMMCVSVSAEAPSLISETAVLIDAETGQVLYDKMMHEQRFPASITKIATVVTALENGNLSDTFAMSDNAVWSIDRSTSHIALDVAEEITLEQACYAALMVSANDACNGMAEHCGGTIENFVSMMNATAIKAGAKNTNFANAHGLINADHKTTAYDMAMICRYALSNPEFKKIFSTYKYEMPPNNKQPETRYFVNQHHMISDQQWKYDGIIGGKEGYTSDAQCTLVTVARRNDRTLIAVVMKSSKDFDRYNDTIALFDHGFSDFEVLSVTNSDIPSSLGCTIENDIRLTVPVGTKKSSLKFSVSGKSDGSLLSISDSEGTQLASFPCKVTKSKSAAAEDDLKKDKKGISFFGVVGIILLVAVGLAAIFVVAIIVRKKIYRVKRKYYRKRRRW